MQTRKDCMMKTIGLVGDWITPDYFSPLCNQAYEEAIMYLEGSCSPYIEKVVIVPGVTIGSQETNLVPYGATAAGGQVQTYPLANLVEPRYVDFKPSGSTTINWMPVCEYTILPDCSNQFTPTTYDIRVRGDFRPAPLVSDDSAIEIHPLASHPLAYSTAALIGMERPNPGWVQNFGPRAQSAWDEIARQLTRQQQHLTFRLGSPNRGDYNRGNNYGWNFNLQGNLGWEWRSFGLFLKMV